MFRFEGWRYNYRFSLSRGGRNSLNGHAAINPLGGGTLRAYIEPHLGHRFFLMSYFTGAHCGC
ncbi:hypothetical protein SRABI13_00960 [Erwinia aphidicola]|nr:hypothetical protein SRABI13_00960 [Erwinia aphidicola]